MHRIRRKLAGTAAMALFAAVVGTVTADRTYAQEKKVKDQAEFDLYNNVVKETDPAKKLQYLNQWVEKYPETDYQEEQARFFSDLGQPAKAIELSTKILAKNPKSFVALSLITANIRNLPSATPDQLATADKASHTLLDNMDSLKPSNINDDQWKQARPSIETLAKGTIMWITMKPGVDAVQKKDYAAAEQGFTKALQQYPESADIAYQLGSALISQRDPNKFPHAIYEIARAVATDPAKGGLPEATRKQVDAYLNRIYTQYHGADDEGLKQLKELALKSPTPPADFKIKTASEIATEKEEEFKTKNPQLALWMGIKKLLSDTGGDQYFESTLKGAAVPKLKGTLVEAKPACRPKELLVAISDATHTEISLKLDMSLTGKPETGSEIQFQGVPGAFTKDPFLLTMDLEKANLEDVKMEPCAAAPPRSRAGARKGVAKK